MSQKLTSEKGLSSKILNKGLYRDLYTRPSDWLTLPTVSSSEQKVVGLYAVFERAEANYIAFIAAGAFTVDWGDGTVENFSSGATASHQYDYATISSGTLSTRGYRQAVITITPQEGQNLTSLDFSITHPIFSSTTSVISDNWLDVAISSPNLTSIKFGRGSVPKSESNMLEQISILSNGTLTDLSSMFEGCSSLKVAPKFNTSGSTNSSSMFEGCSELASVPRYELKDVTNMNSMFRGCTTLRTIPYIDTSSCTSMSYMFAFCRQLRKIFWINTSKVTDVSYMFMGCSSLLKIPLLDVSKVTSADLFLSGCSSLQELPKFNFSSLVYSAGLFKDCSSLIEIPEINFPNLTTLGKPLSDTGTFSGCSSLRKINAIFGSTITTTNKAFNNCGQLIELPNATIVSTVQGDSNFTGGMFTNCASLRKIPSSLSLNTITFVSNMFNGCYLLTEIPASIDLSSNTGTISNGFGSMYNLERFAAIPPKNNFQISSSPKLSLTAVTELLNNLVYYSTARTVTIGACLGTTGNNAAITRTSGITSGSTTITQANTTGLSVGMLVTGTGVSTARAVTFQDTGDTVTLTNHGLTNGKIVSFSTITTTTGISVYTRYYVVNATTNTFQVSDTLGGAARTLTSNGSGNMLVGTYITAITPNTSVTVDVPATATNASASLTYRTLDTFIATSKNWSVSV